MKKMFLSLAVLVALSAQTLFAAGLDDDKQKAAETLSKEFAGAKQVSWSKIENQGVYLASFVLDETRFNAYFDENGSLIAAGRYISADRLPLQVSRLLEKKYAGYEVQEVIELVKNSETSYVITVENADRKVMLQAYDNGTATIVKKVKKD